MPTAARTPSNEHDQGRAWIVLGSMLVGQRLDKRAAVRACISAIAILAVSILILDNAALTSSLASCAMT